LVPADRFFGAAPEVLKTLRARVAANALELARQGLPKAPFYLTGQVGGQAVSLHAEGQRVFLTRGPQRQEVDLVAPTPAPPVYAAPRAAGGRARAGAGLSAGRGQHPGERRPRGAPGAGHLAVGRGPGPVAPPLGNPGRRCVMNPPAVVTERPGPAAPTRKPP